MRFLESRIDLPREWLPFVLLICVAVLVAWLIWDAHRYEKIAERPVRLDDRSTWRKPQQVDNAFFWASGVAIIFACFMLGHLVAVN